MHFFGHIFARGTSWLHRFSLAWSALGFTSAAKIFVFARRSRKVWSLRLPNGKWFHFRGKVDQGVVSHFYRRGYWIEDSPEQRIQTILDCGANIGDETARFRMHHPQANIVAVEPADENFALLQQNFASDGRTTLLHGAVWPTAARLRIVPNAHGAAEAYRVEETDDATNSLAAYSIADILHQRGWQQLDILKLDIEGAEYELFTRNYQAWLARVNVLIFEVPDNDRAGTTQAIFAALAGHSFNCFVCGENLVLIRSGLPWKLRTVTGFNSCRAISM